MRFTSFVTALAILCGLTSTVKAGQPDPGHPINALGRWLGYGWSRGYHAQEGGQTNLDNNPLNAADRYFEPTPQSVEHAQPTREPLFPMLQPARPADSKPASRSVLPAPKSTPPTVEAPLPDNARHSRHPTYPLRTKRYPFQSNLR